MSVATVGARRRAQLDADVTSEPATQTSVGLGVVALLLGIAAYTVSGYPLGSREPLVQVLQWAVLVVASIRIGVLVAIPRPRYALLVFWSFVYVIFGIIQVVQLSRHDNPFHVFVGDGQMVQQLVIVLVGAIAFDLAASAAAARSAAATVARPRVLVPKRVVGFCVASLALFPFFVVFEGGVHALFGSRLDVGASTSTQGGQAFSALLAGAANVIPIVALFALIAVWRQAVTADNRGLYRALLAAVVVENVCLNNPISQPRYWIATFVVGAMLTAALFRRPAGRAAFVVFFVLATAVAFPYLDAFRYDGVGKAQVHREAVSYFFTNKTDYGTATDLVNTLSYVDDHGHTDGRQVAGALLFFVPRSVWPSKPQDTAALLAREIHFQNQNIDSPLWAEGYVDLGLPGVVGLLGFVGYLFGSAERRWLATRHLRTGVWTLLLPLLVGYELLLIRGSLLQSMGRLSLLLVSFAVLAAAPSPRAADPDPPTARRSIR